LANKVNFYKGKQSSYDTKLTNNEIDDLSFYLTKDDNDIPQDAYLGKLKLTNDDSSEDYLPLSGGTITGPIVETQGSYVHKVTKNTTGDIADYKILAMIDFTKKSSNLQNNQPLMFEVISTGASQSSIYFLNYISYDVDFTYYGLTTGLCLIKQSTGQYALVTNVESDAYFYVVRYYNPNPLKDGVGINVTWMDQNYASDISANTNVIYPELGNSYYTNGVYEGDLQVKGNSYVYRIKDSSIQGQVQFAKIHIAENFIEQTTNSAPYGPLVLDVTYSIGEHTNLYFRVSTGSGQAPYVENHCYSTYGNIYLNKIDDYTYGVVVNHYAANGNYLQVNHCHNAAPQWLSIEWDSTAVELTDLITVKQSNISMADGNIVLNNDSELIMNNTSMGLILTDSTGKKYPGICDNSSNLWIGAYQAESGRQTKATRQFHHTGEVLISSGINADGKTWTDDSDGNEYFGNETIKICVPNVVSPPADSGGIDYRNYPVLHTGNIGQRSINFNLGIGISGNGAELINTSLTNYADLTSSASGKSQGISRNNLKFGNKNCYNSIYIGSYYATNEFSSSNIAASVPACGGDAVTAIGGTTTDGRTEYIILNAVKDIIVRLSSTGENTNGTDFAGSALRPATSGQSMLGRSSYRWDTGYFSSAISTTSDKNLKKDIENLDDKYLDLMLELQPKSFKFIDNTSNRTHVGFISQDVEELLDKYGLTALDFAGFCKDKKTETRVIKEAILDEDGNIVQEEETEDVEVLDENGNPEYVYSLRYEEFIAINTALIQRQQKQINELTEKIDSLINK
jgi:hypothetical protein